MSDARAVIDQHIDAFNSRTPDNEPWSDDAEMIAPPGSFAGRDAILGFLSVFQQAFFTGILTIDSVVAAGNRISVEGTFTGTHDGILHSPSGPVSATHRPVSFRWSAT